MRKALSLLSLLLFIFLLSSCDWQLTAYSKTYLYFDTFVKITIHSSKGEKSLEEYFNHSKDILELYHNLTNRYEEEKEGIVGVYTINKNPDTYIKISDELFTLLKESTKDYGMNEYFSIGIGMYSNIWHPYFERYAVDSCESTEPTSIPTLPSVSYDTDTNLIELDEVNKTVKIPNNYSLDLGGVVKGYVSKLLIEYLSEAELKFTIDMGASNIFTNIGNPKKKNNQYAIGLIDPKSVGCGDVDTYKIVSLPLDYSIVTSGDYQRYFIYEDRIYSHILDKNTGFPAVTDIRSISIILKDPFLGDILSTSLFIMGKDKALEYINSNEDIEGIIYTNDGIYYSDNFNKYIVE